MIFAELTHRLGNQLFQYAAARALAARLGASLRLDASSFNGSTNSGFQLHRFRIRASRATRLEEECLARLKRPRAGRLMDSLHRYRIPVGLHRLVDQEQGFDERILAVRGNVLLRGFWQSERYFNSIAPMLREELTFKDAPDAANAAMLRQMASCEAVVVHVRRGDYVSNAAFHAVHGICDVAYYRRGLELLRQSVRDPHCFIFSDDPDWVKQNLKLDAPCTYVTHNVGKQDHEDLRLMSHGQHFIIANSTFSWWGAWLSRHPGKQVIAPRRWFQSEAASGRDIVPEAWTAI